MFSLRALWKGLRGQSLVFSVVFAFAVLGFSLAGLLRSPMRAIGLWGPLVFLLPLILVGWTARLEKRLELRVPFRRWCCYGLIFGSILLSLMLWAYQRHLRQAYAESIQPGPRFEEPARPADLPRGPRHRP